MPNTILQIDDQDKTYFSNEVIFTKNNRNLYNSLGQNICITKLLYWYFKCNVISRMSEIGRSFWLDEKINYCGILPANDEIALLKGCLLLDGIIY